MEEKNIKFKVIVGKRWALAFTLPIMPYIKNREENMVGQYIYTLEAPESVLDMIKQDDFYEVVEQKKEKTRQNLVYWK